MKTYVFEDKGKIELINGEAENIKEGSAKIRITKLGLTKSDAELLADGRTYPFVAGRQAVGLVSEAYEGSTLVRNEKVYLSPYVPCGKCINCKTDNVCSESGIYGLTQDGFLRDFITISEASIIKLPEQVSDSEAIFCEYVAMATEIVNKLKFEKGEHIAILGGDILGNLVAQLCIHYNAIPILIDSCETNLEHAKSAGIYYTVSEGENAEKFLYSVSGGKMAKYIVHISGTAKPFKDTLSLAALGATIIIAGFSSGKMMCNLAAVLEKKLKIIGINSGQKELRTAINMLATKAVNVSIFAQKEVKFKEIPQVLTEQAKKDDETSVFQVIADCLKE